jgi:hypothetical protein
LAIINITQKIAESGVFVVILWTFVLQEYWPLYTNHVIKDYMHPMEDITVYRPFTTNIWILNLLYSKLPVAYCWIQTPVEARFSRPIHTGPKACPSICPMGTRSLLGSKTAGHCTNCPPSFWCWGWIWVELYPYLLFFCLLGIGTDCFVWLYIVTNISSGSSIIFVNVLVITIPEYYYWY